MGHLKPLLAGALVGTLVRIAWASIPYSRPAFRPNRPYVMRYHTILTEGVVIRGRVRGRLYSADFWREHGDR